MLKRLALALPALLAVSAFAEQTMRINNFKTLAVIYRGQPDADNYLDQQSVEIIQNGFELGRAFYYRNSHARFNVDFTWALIDDMAPDNAGPNYDGMWNDLVKRGHIREGQYDGIIVTGRDMKGNWGGFNLPGGTAGCFGWGWIQGNLTWYPEDKPNVGYGAAWIFVHEFQHAVDLVAMANEDLPMLHSHPYTDRFDEHFQGYYKGGEHFDWCALTLREVPVEQWLQLQGVTGEFLDVVDADGDNMPDDDPRLPMDERRFGSDPTKPDTDGDGLDDLHEFIADRYAGSDPNDPDTDGDGMTDGEDLYPIIAIKPELDYASHARFDELPVLIDSCFVRTDEGGQVRLHAGWNESELYLRFVGPRKFRTHVKIDGSWDSGFWQGGDTYVIEFRDGEAKFLGFDREGKVPGATSVGHGGDGEPYMIDVKLPAALGQGFSWPPGQPVEGLTLKAGRRIGFNVHYIFEDDKRAVLTPHHHMYGTTLVKPTDAPENPVLQVAKRSAALEPMAEVYGISPTSRVRVMDGHKIVGTRVGPGPLPLVGLDRDGEYGLVARTDHAVGPQKTIEIDRSANAPMADDASNPDELVLRAEPGAAIEVWWGIDGVPSGPLTGMDADDAGMAKVPLSDKALIDGWLVRGFKGKPFEEPVFIESWPKIERFFKGGPADPRLPDDGFSYIFEGLFVVDDAGLYTFELECDDGGRVYVDDELIVNNWGQHGMRKRSGVVRLNEGVHRVVVRYYEQDGWAGVKLRYAPSGEDLTFDIPVSRSPLPLDEIELYVRQTDVLGNTSEFAPIEQP